MCFGYIHKIRIVNMSTGSKTDDVLFETLKNAGVITLNRPKSLNAINLPILSQMLPILWDWEKNKRLIIIKGTGRAFCAGGDIKASIEKVQKGQIDQNIDMLLVEYNVNHLTGNLKVPYVAIMDGIAMGGGLGLSVHGPYRVATENTVVSMPETKIGLIPDVGASYFLPRLPFNVGIYLGLTSNVLKEKAAVAVNIATHFVSSHRLVELEHALSNCFSDDDVKATLETFHEPVGELSGLVPNVKDIDYCFSAETVEDIIERLTSVNTEWSTNIIMTLRKRCPLSLKLTLKALKLGAHMNLWNCLQMEYTLCSRLVANHNFMEGVRALLIERNNKPQWIPKTIEEVNESDVQQFFEPLPNGELLFLSNKNSKL